MTYAQITKEGNHIISAALTIDGIRFKKRVQPDDAQKLDDAVNHEIGQPYDTADVICENDDGQKTRIPPGKTEKALVNGVSYSIDHWSKEKEEEYKRDYGYGQPPGTGVEW